MAILGANRFKSVSFKHGNRTFKTSRNMRVFLAGISCVGKSTVGSRLAGLLNCRFFDLDFEIERFFGKAIERLQNRYLTPRSFRVAASQALQHFLCREDARTCVIALPPSGLMDAYWKVVSKANDTIIVVLKDTPENILKRVTFHDIDFHPIKRNSFRQGKAILPKRDPKGHGLLS